MLEIDEDAVPFVLELLKECWNVGLFNADTFAILVEDYLDLYRSKVRNIVYFFDLGLDIDGFATVLEVDRISG